MTSIWAQLGPCEAHELALRHGGGHRPGVLGPLLLERFMEVGRER